MKLRNLVATAVAALALATVAAAASAAPAAAQRGTGSWTGMTSQDIAIIDPATGDDIFNEWSVRITVTALHGRLLGIATTVRAVCAGPAVKDIRIVTGWPRGTGPRLTVHGGFHTRLAGVSIAGVLGAKHGSGHFDVSSGGCDGKGSWSVKRVF
ncbi:MAG TPA: hypothetical protein VNH40_12250 [Gaiellaceae bacterium]|nr:hypothetical protein [Gaiellaceae bacterium]